MYRVLYPFVYTSMLLSGMILGFFYAWVCSTMWGLDQLDPNAAIDAMNAMNISVRNLVFMPTFFLTPVLLAVTGVIAWSVGAKTSAQLFVGASVLYIAGAFIPTATINVPMNDALKLVQTPLPLEDARVVWADYSSRWQLANQARTVVAAIVFLMATVGLSKLPRQSA